jgi:hypothetical protein
MIITANYEAAATTDHAQQVYEGFSESTFFTYLNPGGNYTLAQLKGGSASGITSVTNIAARV